LNLKRSILRIDFPEQVSKVSHTCGLNNLTVAIFAGKCIRLTSVTAPNATLQSTVLISPAMAWLLNYPVVANCNFLLVINELLIV